MKSPTSKQRAYDRVAVLGAGAWGTALAQVAAHAGSDVILWGRDEAVIRDIASRGENSKYLAGVPLHKAIRPVVSVAECAPAQLFMIVTPAQSLRDVSTQLIGIADCTAPIIVCAKGIERASRKFATDIVTEILPENPIAVLSGPSFAADVVRGLPTAVTLAANDIVLAEAMAKSLATPSFRLYHSSDVRGVEIGGAAKNVLAIACGIAEGCQLGASAQAALIARGFAELRRFGLAYGADQETLLGLSGLGDLVLTCSSAQSRNFALGQALGEGASIGEAGGGKLAEGVFTSRVLTEMAIDAGIDMPIAESVNAILEGKLEIQEAIANLMMRPQRGERGAI